MGLGSQWCFLLFGHSKLAPDNRVFRHSWEAEDREVIPSLPSARLSPPVVIAGHHRSVLGKGRLLSCWFRANPCPSHFNFLDPLMWNSSVIQFFIFRKKGYWYKSNFLVSFRKVLLRMAFFSGHLSSSPFRTRTQRP